MHVTKVLLGALSILPPLTCIHAQQIDSSQWPIHDNGLNKVVEWYGQRFHEDDLEQTIYIRHRDHYSFIINGQRLYIFGGEFHYWRFPVPELWEDLLLKIKAAGFNSFSIYSNWAYHAPSPTTLDFTSGSRNFTSIFTLAKKIGLYVLYRPGPYVNAETNAGGFPLWLITGDYGTLRNNDTRYTKAWIPYMEECSKIVAPHLITNGGNVIAFQIENEYGEQWLGNSSDRVPNIGAGQYMALLEQVARENGINIPLSHNDPNMNTNSWSMDYAPGAQGNVDIHGVDSYPSCWSCNLDECTTTNGPYIPFQVQQYFDYWAKDSPTQPNFLPEFQGGSYNPWGGPRGGCPENSNQDFANVFYRHNIAERSTAQNLYMLYGGTSWGYLPAPVVATSYDYSAPISENRMIAAKYYETKLLALFLRSAKDLVKTERLGNNTEYSNNANVMTSELRNPDTNAAFYVTIHANSSSSNPESFRLTVNTSVGALKIPQYAPETVLDGHQSKIISTDFSFSDYSLLYTTAEILSVAIHEGVSIIAFWVPTGESGEISFKHLSTAEVVSSAGGSDINFHRGNGSIVISFTQKAGISVINFDGGKMRVLLMDRGAAYKFWAPQLTTNPLGSENQTVFVQGPYLVRAASISGSALMLSGDLDSATNITIFAPRDVSTVTWNNLSVSVIKSVDGSLVGSMKGPVSPIKLPGFTGWRSANSLPEAAVDYDDSGPAWVVANRTETSNPTPPDTLPVLYVDEYGFHTGISLYRARISGIPSALNLGVQGGTAFGFSVFLNSEHIYSYTGNSSAQAHNATINIASSALKARNNVLLVVMDNTGHGLRTLALEPRGILYANLTGGTIDSWKIAGSAGGEASLDPIRGPLAEGGLACERLGWHLPGFSDAAWPSLSPSTGKSNAGVEFYRTTANLSIPDGVDVSIAFTLDTLSNITALRTILWVNGYNFGLFNPSIGNQSEFPVPPGILNYQGENTIAVSVWNQDGTQPARLDVGWKVVYMHTTGYDFKFDSGALRPRWDASREQYR